MTALALTLLLSVDRAFAADFVGDWAVEVAQVLSSCDSAAPHWVGEESRWTERWRIVEVGGGHPSGTIAAEVLRGHRQIRFDGAAGPAGLMARAQHWCSEEASGATITATYDVRPSSATVLVGTLVVAYVVLDHGAPIACARVFSVAAVR